ncbi:MAG: hypothetical protein HY238_20945 [Acidobacteria bacterium]|nr:hypothetical protein [Acidobacteriota bacterium]
MVREIKLTEARRRLSSLVRQVANNPEIRYSIVVRNMPVAELRSPDWRRASLSAGAWLLKLSDDFAGRGARRGKGPQVTSQNYKEFLYGNWPPGNTQRRR